MAAAKVPDRNIGSIIREANNLNADQIEKVLSYQREHDVKFGEAAVALGFIERSQVLWALSQQFGYSYALAENSAIGEELVIARHPFEGLAEDFRDMRSQLLSSVFLSDGPRRRGLAVISPNSGDGKTFYAANLAVAFSQLEGRTLLVDADMRTPRLHEIFNVKSSAGLSGILSGRFEANVVRPVEELPNLYLLPVGVVPPNPLELVHSAHFQRLLEELVAKFDYVIVDTPAAAHGADARVIMAACGGSVAIIRRGTTRAVDLDSFRKVIDSPSHKFAGVVLNDCP